MFPLQDCPIAWHASSTLRVVWFIIMTALREKREVVTIVQKAHKRNLEIALGNTDEITPPLWRLSGKIIQTFCQIGKLATQNVKSPFSYSYECSPHAHKFTWFIDHTKVDENTAGELENLLKKSHQAEKEQRLEERIKKIQKRKFLSFAKYLIAGTAIITAIAIAMAARLL